MGGEGLGMVVKLEEGGKKEGWGGGGSSYVCGVRQMTSLGGRKAREHGNRTSKRWNINLKRKDWGILYDVVEQSNRALYSIISQIDGFTLHRKHNALERYCHFTEKSYGRTWNLPEHWNGMHGSRRVVRVGYGMR